MIYVLCYIRKIETPDQNNIIEATLTMLGIEAAPGQCYDYVKIYDGRFLDFQFDL